MRNKYLPFILYCIILFIVFGISITISYIRATNSSNIDTTRDYKYEHYCDSIFDSNPDYYIDVLVETDKYQDYVKNHGEWWNN